MRDDSITFSFGENWSDFVTGVNAEIMEGARQDLEAWLDKEDVEGKTVLDIGSGSGIHSSALLALGASRLRSFDYDPHSVSATTKMYESAGKPDNWEISEGSVLDKEFVSSLGSYDLVYSWGVLHHTGSMWEAIENAITCVKPGGKFFIALYAAGPRFEADLALKQKYNAASPRGKRMMEYRWIANLMHQRLMAFKNPFAWNEKRIRGMNVYHDLVDWLGGLPYEVASEDETVVFCRKRNLVLDRIKVYGEGACNIFLFTMSDAPA
jgi:SAM-dependent methyltransferase